MPPPEDLTFLEGHDPEALAELEAQGIGEGDFEDDPCYTPAIEWDDE